eukprot:TRINITY_DN6047_c4_g1_i1.p1 TRINITY_DN6047_c4_g1~~TRINITY_DN6047_c4_g1_i1.p1  ORF type:complete len:509 (+),score=58.72 TRINITY_DN6047_c4_g1_i1:102-1628(+)
MKNIKIGLELGLAAVLVFVVMSETPEFEYHATMLDTISNVFIGDIPRVGLQGWDYSNEAPLFYEQEVEAHLVYLTGVRYSLSRYLPSSVLTNNDTFTMDVVMLSNNTYKDITAEKAVHFDTSTITKTYNITEEFPLGPFSPSSPDYDPDLWWKVVDLKLSIEFKTVHLGGWVVSYRPAVLLWTIDIKYDLSERTGVIPLSWRITRKHEKGFAAVSSPKVIIRFILLSVTGALSIVLLLECLSTGITGSWLVVEVVNCAASIVSSILSFAAIAWESSPTMETTDQCATAFSCFIAWIVLVKPLSGLPGMLDVYKISKKTLPSALRFGVPVFIIFMSMACFGTCALGREYGHFRTVDLSFELLYSLMVGDAIYDTFTDTYRQMQTEWGGLLARGYCYCSVLFMYYVVLNQFFAVMEDGYRSATQPHDIADHSSYSDNESGPALSVKGIPGVTPQPSICSIQEISSSSSSSNISRQRISRFGPAISAAGDDGCHLRVRRRATSNANARSDI